MVKIPCMQCQPHFQASLKLRRDSPVQLKVPESWSPQVHSGVALGMMTEVFWQGLLKKVPKRLCIRGSFCFKNAVRTCMSRLETISPHNPELCRIFRSLSV